MRVAYICGDPGIPVFGTKGASVHVQEIIRCWRALGAEVHVYATRIGRHVPPDLADLAVTHVPVPEAPRGDGPAGSGEHRRERAARREQAQKEATRLIAEQVIAAGADAVYERYSLFSSALAEVTEALGVPGILEVNAPLIDEQRTHRDLIDERSAYAALDRQVAAATRTACVSAPVADWVLSTVRRSPATEEAALRRRVLVAPNGVNVDRIRPSLDSQVLEAQVTDPASSAGSAGRAPVVVFVGTLKPWHGVEHLIAARGLARERWRLRIVGDGPQRAALQDQARAAGVEAEFTGAVVPAEIPGHLLDCAVAAAPYPSTAQSSDQYFSPLKIYEYCAAALPVVASRVGQVPEIIDDGATGVLVEPSDPAALAQAIDELVADPRRRRAMGRTARAMAVSERSWDRVLATVLEGTGLEPAGGRG
ncbi:glycosyltransferase family 4 protein [Kocuria coralli]|uniref:Glycosyltransferase family 4 protein n=1 Tax=Kocuria coralli TaxID=1461025 RepID=A0A5J5L2C4_9MICC|nr:glycosyltransferase family 4 protein [Kocuria coralli]KAA9395246.1 glycosyltransferase family 4 protein [Kocuria coralli]